MLPFEDRYTRQRRLREIGDSGQTRIAQAEYRLGSQEGTLFAAAYLERAGAERVWLRAAPDDGEFAHAEAFRFTASREIATGAWKALRELRRALALERR